MPLRNQFPKYPFWKTPEDITSHFREQNGSWTFVDNSNVTIRQKKKRLAYGVYYGATCVARFQSLFEAQIYVLQRAIDAEYRSDDSY